MKVECIFIALIVSFVRIRDPTVRLKLAGNDAAFKWFGFEWQMLYKTNYPQEDEKTFHLPFQSTFGLFFTFIYPLVCWETCLLRKLTSQIEQQRFPPPSKQVSASYFYMISVIFCPRSSSGGRIAASACRFPATHSVMTPPARQICTDNQIGTL